MLIYCNKEILEIKTTFLGVLKIKVNMKTCGHVDRNVSRPQCVPSYHEVQVESLSTVSKVPETLHPRCTKHHGEVVLVGAPEQLLVRHAWMGVRHGPAADPTPKHKDKKQAGTREQHV